MSASGPRCFHCALAGLAVTPVSGYRTAFLTGSSQTSDKPMAENLRPISSWPLADKFLIVDHNLRRIGGETQSLDRPRH